MFSCSLSAVCNINYLHLEWMQHHAVCGQGVEGAIKAGL